MTLTSSIYWGLSHKSFLFMASRNGPSGPPCRDSLATCLASAVFLNHRRRFHNLFTRVSFTSLKPVPTSRCRPVQLLAWAGVSPCRSPPLPSSAACLASTTHPLNHICNVSPFWLLFNNTEKKFLRSFLSRSWQSV